MGSAVVLMVKEVGWMRSWCQTSWVGSVERRQERARRL